MIQPQTAEDPSGDEARDLFILIILSISYISYLFLLSISYTVIVGSLEPQSKRIILTRLWAGSVPGRDCVSNRFALVNFCFNTGGETP